MGKVLTDEEKDALIFGKKQSVEEVKEEVKETKEVVATEETKEITNEVKQEVVSSAEETKTEPEFDLASFNKKFGLEIESEDTLKSLFEKAGKYDETKTSYEDTVQKLTEYKGLAEKLDPLSNFLNEDEYKRQQLLIKMKDELGEDAIKELAVLNPSKIKELDNVEALKLQLMIEKGISRNEADIYLKRRYDVDDFGDELDESVKTAIKVDAIDARKNVAKIYDGIELPTKVDYEAARVQLRDAWEKSIPEIVKGIDKIELEQGIDFVVTDEMKKGLDTELLQSVMSRQIKPSEDTVASLVGNIKDQLVIRNIDKVIKSIRTDLTESIKAEVRKEIHNDKPLNESTRQSQDRVLSNDEKVSRIIS